MMGNVFTVGNEKSYDLGLKSVPGFAKLGRTREYAGGFACKSAADAAKLIVEFNKVGEWAVYRLMADWEKDTVPSENGWWHALIPDAPVIEKCEAWRRLEADEIIEEGDEVDGCADLWRDEPKWEPTACVGERAPDPQYPAHRQYRRRIS